MRQTTKITFVKPRVIEKGMLITVYDERLLGQ